MKTEKSITATEKPKAARGILTVFLACFTFVGLLWIFVFSDMIAQVEHAKYKDYAAEEVQNRELAKQMIDGASTLKLIDENAEQFVNVATVEPQEEQEKEEEKKPVVEEPDPVGEEF